MNLIPRSQGKDRQRIGDPIDPEYLRAAEQIRPDLSKAAPPAAPGRGSLVYRLYCTQGLWGWNGQMGLLRLEAVPGREEGEEEIRILQVSLDGGSQRGNRFIPSQAVFRLEGRMCCRENQPISWELASAVYDYTGDRQGKFIDETRLRESFETRGEELQVTIGGRIHNRLIPASKWMSEWNLLRLVGRLPFGEDPNLKFCFLEGLTLSPGWSEAKGKPGFDTSVLMKRPASCLFRKFQTTCAYGTTRPRFFR